MLKDYQFSTRSIMVVTLLTALWCGLFSAASTFALAALGIYLVFVIAFATRDRQVLFWLPLVAISNWIFLTLWMAFGLTTLHYLILGLLSLFSISMFAIDNTLYQYRNSKTQKGVMLVGIAMGFIAESLVAIMVGVPILLFEVYAQTVLKFSFAAGSFSIAPQFAYFVAMAGIFIAVILGIVCDVLVAMKFRNQIRPVVRERPLELDEANAPWTR